jgi:hypothetical protein
VYTQQVVDKVGMVLPELLQLFLELQQFMQLVAVVVLMVEVLLQELGQAVQEETLVLEMAVLGIMIININLLKMVHLHLVQTEEWVVAEVDLSVEMVDLEVVVW